MEALKRYASIPFKDKGRDYDGCDCWGIPYLMYRDLLKIALPAYVEECKDIHDADAVQELVLRERVAWTRVDTPKPYDLIEIRMRGRRMHCGVYIGDGRFIHCLEGAGTVVERTDAALWRNRIAGYYRYTP